MPRFSDGWVVDRTMFDYVQGGSCSCCGFSHLFNPDGLKGLINAVSDLETDAANDEYDAALKSPWPPDMRDQIWADRVRLRHKMKKEMKNYSQFLHDCKFFLCPDENDVGDAEALHKFCASLGGKTLMRIFQMPRAELSERVGNIYDIHSAFAIVLCTVVEQVANFKLTAYDTDARSPEEIAFEETLTFNRRAGFNIPVATKVQGTQEYQINQPVLKMFVDLVVQLLAGPKLLHRGPPKPKPAEQHDSEDEDDDEDGAASGGEMVKGQKGPSFRSDRRIIRLLIARYWADQIIEKFRSQQKQDEKTKNEDSCD
mmetsp:Transcript_15097/g.20561  ORF Transcript_15097/g.20561 Transcript_15097/m.20561 type:complete len:313 (-) Transcript_15097:286-1224(-)|eukprot:CAMPEP_0185728498 /NCGR_PEP_ID=MMETSP1171-20130828/3814_1 /TAXON_ID=374046 /ORGANISM="Helicotheca tamensis, Strain CCMP826" /LENGTH=312 /DNA_ID=CAMNT_0028397213 /DNA_START=115 /DNA_END=1053 /DNA_ORIENTATION=-